MSDLYLLATSFWTSGFLLSVAYLQVRHVVALENAIVFEPWERI